MKEWFELGPFTIFDLETTGMSPVYDRIIEIAAIHVDIDGTETSFHSLVNPGCPVPPQATRVNNISDAMLVDAPTFSRIAPEFMKLVHGSTLVAHNARFDLGFLQESLSRTGQRLWDGKTLDTLRLTRQAFKGLPSYSLQSLRAALNLPDCNEDAHRAHADAILTRHLLERTLSALMKLSAPTA